MNRQAADSPVAEVVQTGETLIARVVGDVDMRRSTAFQQSLMDLFDRSPRRIVLDLSEAGYVDSSGLAGMVKLLSRGREDDVELRLCCPNAAIRHMLEITRLDGVFVVCPTLDEALA